MRVRFGALRTVTCKDDRPYRAYTRLLVVFKKKRPAGTPKRRNYGLYVSESCVAS